MRYVRDPSNGIRNTVTALREIARTPADWHRIMHDHAQVRALLRHQDMLDSMTTDLKASGHRDDHRFILAKRARREISRRLEELGLDPNKTDRLPRNYRYPKN